MEARTVLGKRTRLGWANWAAGLCVSLLVVCLTSGFAAAQQAMGVDPTGRSADEPPLFRQEPRPNPPPGHILPPLPPSPARPTVPLPLERVFIREILVTGSTVFSPAELAEVTAPYVRRELTAEDLEEVRLALTRHYVERGYINSGAILPDQILTEGVLTVHVIEGELTHIEVEGNRRFRDRYLQNRLALGTGPPLNIHSLRERLQLLLQDPRFQRLNTELQPGVRPGESVLAMRVEERNPLLVWLEFNNFQSPTVGAERGLVTVAHHNLTGHGDILSVRYGRSSGVDSQLDASYLRPLTAYDTTIHLEYRKNDFLVVEAPFDPLDIESTSEIFGITLRQPIYRTLDREFTLMLTGERLTNRTFLLDQPFSGSPGEK